MVSSNLMIGVLIRSRRFGRGHIHLKIEAETGGVAAIQQRRPSAEKQTKNPGSDFLKVQKSKNLKSRYAQGHALSEDCDARIANHSQRVTWAFSCGEQVPGLLIVVASLVADYGLQASQL